MKRGAQLGGVPLLAVFERDGPAVELSDTKCVARRAFTISNIRETSLEGFAVVQEAGW